MRRPICLPIAESCAYGHGAAPVARTERTQNGDFASATGWDTSGAAWAIALGEATNSTAGQFLTNTLVDPILAGDSVTATVTVTDNPAFATWMISLYNTSTLASQAVLSVSDGPGTYSNASPVVATGTFDAVRIRAIADVGLVLDTVSVLA